MALPDLDGSHKVADLIHGLIPVLEKIEFVLFSPLH